MSAAPPTAPSGPAVPGAAAAGPAGGGDAIEMVDVAHGFAGDGGRHQAVLETFNLYARPGEFLAIVGPSGCGKTTVLNMIAGLLQPDHGTVAIAGKPPTLGHPSRAYLLARDALMPWRTALQNVVLPLELRKVPKAQALARATDILGAVGLGGAMHRYPSQLSHGMRQRVAVARTLITHPTLVMMDEPFSALDAQTRLLIQRTFLELWEREKPTVVFVTHDLAEAIIMADRILVFSRRPGRVLADCTVDLERPRDVMELQDNPNYHALYRELWGYLRSAVDDSARAPNPTPATAPGSSRGEETQDPQ